MVTRRVPPARRWILLSAAGAGWASPTAGRHVLLVVLLDATWLVALVWVRPTPSTMFMLVPILQSLEMCAWSWRRGMYRGVDGGLLDRRLVRCGSQ